MPSTVNRQLTGTIGNGFLEITKEFHTGYNLVTYGSNAYGQIGLGSVSMSISSPIQLSSATDWADTSLNGYIEIGLNTASSDAVFLIKPTGALWVWGYNSSGVLGDNSSTNRSSPVQVGSLTNWKQISSFETTLAVKTDGTLWSWGSGSNGSFGTGVLTAKSSPVQVGTSSDWSQVSTANSCAAAIKTDGTLWSWGGNAYGRLGQGLDPATTLGISSPVQVGSLTNWKQVSVGYGSVFAVKTDGTLWSWGNNSNGQLAIGDSLARSSPVQVGSLTNWAQVSVERNASNINTILAIKTDGTLWSWGLNQSGAGGNGDVTTRSSPVQVGNLTNWKSVQIGTGSTVAYKTDGSIWAWGTSTNGQLGNGDSINNVSSPIQLGTSTNWARAAIGRVLIAATKVGRLYGTGYNNNGQLAQGYTVIPQLSQVSLDSSVSIASYSNIAQASTAAIKTDGTLWTCGQNANGELGLGDVTTRSSPVQVGSLTNWKSAYAAPYLASTVFPASTFAIKTDGTLWSWGYNTIGQLGLGDVINRSSPVQVGTSTDWGTISGANGVTFAIKTDGTLWSWGQNANGQLGDNTVVSRSSPVQVGSLTNWKQVASGQNSTAAIKTDGTLWSWGAGLGSFPTRSSPVQVGSLTNWNTIVAGSVSSVSSYLATRTDGTLWSWGSNVNGELGLGDVTTRSSPVQVGTSTDWISTYFVNSAVNPTKMSAFAIKTDGTLWAWGDNTDGQLGLGGDLLGITKYSSPVQVGSFTGWKTPNLQEPFVDDGSGNNIYNFNQYVEKVNDDLVDDTNITYVGSELWVWGLNDNGQLGTSESTAAPRSSPVQLGVAANWRSVFPGFKTAVASKTDGTMWSWGYSLGGQLGDGTVVARSSPVQVGATNNWETMSGGSGGTGSTVHAIRTDGTLWSWGSNTSGSMGIGSTATILYSSPVQVGSLTNWKSVATAKGTPATGGLFSAAIKTDGTLWTWGDNTYGQLGDGTAAIKRSSPVQVGSLTNWKSVGVGEEFVVATKADGTLWSWGYNGGGQLGDGTITNKSSPVQVGNLSNWSKVVAGSGHVLALKTDGTLWSWGCGWTVAPANAAPTAGQLGLQDTSSRSSPVQIGSLNTWKDIAVGDLHSLAVKNDGTIWAWGSNASGQLGLGDVGSRSSPVQVGGYTNWRQVFGSNATTYALKYPS